jgi:hypothetical protein
MAPAQPAVGPHERRGNLAAELSASPDNEQQGRGDQAAPEEPGFVLPAPDASRPDGPRLRRRLLGIKASDVEAEIGARDTEIAELKRDIAALWLAFGQHERTIQEILKAIERRGGGAIAPPGGRGVASQAPTPAGGQPEAGPRGDSIARQLSSLDEVLGAIEEATRTLERSYAEEIKGGGTAASAEAGPSGGEGERAQPPADD